MKRYLKNYLGVIVHVLAALIPLLWHAALVGVSTPERFAGLALWAALMGLLPDVDTRQSYIGRMAGTISEQIEIRYGHRTITHSWLPLVALSPLFLIENGGLIWSAYLSHLVVDMIVGQTGVRLFWPARTSFGFLRLETGGAAERGLLALLVLLCFAPFLWPSESTAIVSAITPPTITPTSAPLSDVVRVDVLNAKDQGEILVKVGDRVERGQLLADLAAYRATKPQPSATATPTSATTNPPTPTHQPDALKLAEARQRLDVIIATATALATPPRYDRACLDDFGQRFMAAREAATAVSELGSEEMVMGGAGVVDGMAMEEIAGWLVGEEAGYRGEIARLDAMEVEARLKATASTLKLTATNTPIPTATGSPTPTKTPTLTKTPTPTKIPTLTKTPTPTKTPTLIRTPTFTATLTSEPAATITVTSTSEPAATITVTSTSEPAATITVTSTSEPTATITVTSTSEPTATITVTSTSEPTATITVTSTSEPAATSTSEPTAAITATLTSEPTAAITATLTSEFAATSTSEPTATRAATQHHRLFLPLLLSATSQRASSGKALYSLIVTDTIVIDLIRAELGIKLAKINQSRVEAETKLTQAKMAATATVADLLMFPTLEPTAAIDLTQVAEELREARREHIDNCRVPTPDPFALELAVQDVAMAELAVNALLTPSPAPLATPSNSVVIMADEALTDTLESGDDTKVYSLVDGVVEAVRIKKAEGQFLDFEIVIALDDSEVASGEGSASIPADAVEVSVVKVADGDTMDVQLPGGEVETVRFLGVDTPETVHPTKPVECYGPEASKHTKLMLCGNETGKSCNVTVWLQSDEQAGERGKYGRLLRHVWRGGGVLHNEELLGMGLARHNDYGTASQHKERYVMAEKGARSGNVGLWGSCD